MLRQQIVASFLFAAAFVSTVGRADQTQMCRDRANQAYTDEYNRCMAAPECRTDADCGAQQQCSAQGTCVERPTQNPPECWIVSDPQDILGGQPVRLTLHGAGYFSHGEIDDTTFSAPNGSANYNDATLGTITVVAPLQGVLSIDGSVSGSAGTATCNIQKSVDLALLPGNYTSETFNMTLTTSGTQVTISGVQGISEAGTYDCVGSHCTGQTYSFDIQSTSSIKMNYGRIWTRN